MTPALSSASLSIRDGTVDSRNVHAHLYNLGGKHESFEWWSKVPSAEKPFTCRTWKKAGSGHSAWGRDDVDAVPLLAAKGRQVALPKESLAQGP